MHKYSTVEKECYSFFKAIQGDQTPAGISDSQMQEWVLAERYKKNEQWDDLPQKRVKYWGEPTDCSSQYQLDRDAYINKKQELLAY